MLSAMRSGSRLRARRRSATDPQNGPIAGGVLHVRLNLRYGPESCECIGGS
jgi:hypothetical protein